jgi:Na+-driven multidrug efflux pump
MQSNSLNQTVLIGQNVGTPRFWRCRKVIYYGAIISMICVITRVRDKERHKKVESAA